MTLEEAKTEVSVNQEGPGYKDFSRLCGKYEKDEIIHFMEKAAKLYAKSKTEELKKLLSRCEKTFGVLDELIETLKVCKKNDLPDAVKAIDIDFKLMQAEIKDTIR